MRINGQTLAVDPLELDSTVNLQGGKGLANVLSGSFEYLGHGLLNMRILFSHQNYPAQFGDFSAYLARNGWKVTFMTAAVRAAPPEGCRIVQMKPHRNLTPGVHHFATSLENAMIHGQSIANAAIRARENGLVPDIVVAYSGWGVGTFAKAVWPECRYVAYVEWYYRWPPIDAVAPDPRRTQRTVVRMLWHATRRRSSIWLKPTS